jgi:hypothetical protein
LVEPFLNPTNKANVWLNTKSLDGVSSGWAKCG